MLLPHSLLEQVLPGGLVGRAVVVPSAFVVVVDAVSVDGGVFVMVIGVDFVGVAFVGVFVVAGVVLGVMFVVSVGVVNAVVVLVAGGVLITSHSSTHLLA